ncbi:hypothetical protein AAVH_06005 [Aphelenchoides avenae]|nr:hypothetical protein AAVH_06005 [Aphelenchus avenae]
MHLVLFVVAAAWTLAEGQESTALSPCLQNCMAPMVQIEKTIAYVYRNYEKVCDILEKSAHCAQKCGQHDHSVFFQYSTFYRLHCVDMEEELEENLDCLREASYKADVVCREKCNQKSSKNAAKDERQKNVCKSVECATVCYYKQFVKSCPCAQEMLLKLNVRNADEMRRLTQPASLSQLSPQCQRLHDPVYIRQQLEAI